MWAAISAAWTRSYSAAGSPHAQPAPTAPRHPPRSAPAPRARVHPPAPRSHRRPAPPRTTPASRALLRAGARAGQGGFPGDADVKRVRESWQSLSENQKRDSLTALVDWYQGLAGSADQGGIRLDWKQNVNAWRKKISENSVSDEQADLLNLSFLRSRTAQGQSGFWQALTFQRRSKIILSVGCVGGNCVGP